MQAEIYSFIFLLFATEWFLKAYTYECTGTVAATRTIFIFTTLQLQQ